MDKKISNKPTILIEGHYDESDLSKLKAADIWKFHDIRLGQLRELFEIKNPELINTKAFEEKFDIYLKEKSPNGKELSGDYIYFSWSGVLLHTVGEEDIETLRTNRTKSLISSEEQEKIRNFTAGVAGLSFGNGIALSLIYSGASRTIKLADNDLFETTNLNRVRVGIPSVNQDKTTITANEIYEISPYADIELFNEGLNADNLEDFIKGAKKLNIVFDVVDDLAMKVRIRLAAKKAKIPVVMLTSLEDSILVDVERFDLNPDSEIFHGLLGEITEELLTREMTESEKAKYAMAIVGPQSVSYRNLLSLSQVGTKLVSRPHLFGTVSIVCGIASYILKRIALNEDMPSMRRLVRFNEFLDIAPNLDDTVESRKQILDRLMLEKQDK